MTRREDNGADTRAPIVAPSRPPGVPLTRLHKAVSLHGSIDDELVRRLGPGADPGMRDGS
ncbi:MAG: hypothetical protein RIB67_11925 [Miltoncostaeaceae bacterium]